MDPATGALLGAVVTTLGLIIVAFINNRRERAGAAGAGVEAALDAEDVLEKMLSLIAENDRKDKVIEAQKLEIKALRKTRAIASEGDEANDGTHALRPGDGVDQEG